MASVRPNIKRGSAELAVLAVLAEGPLHGYQIATRIAEQTSGVLRFDVASLYPLLYRMEQEGWVKASWQEVGGRRRRYYRLCSKGRKQLRPLVEEWRLFFRALNALAGVGRG